MSGWLGIDLGTSQIRAVVYDPAEGRVRASASLPTPVETPQPGWAEHDPQALWQTLCAVVRQAASGQAVSALAISSFAEAGVPLDAQDRPLAPALAWFDRRTQPQADRWEQHFSLGEIHALTGQRPSTSFSANKWLWQAENVPGVRENTARWLNVPDYLLLRLCGQTAADRTLASRTLWFDQNQLAWSERLADWTGIGVRRLPPVYPAGTPVGRLSAAAAQECGLGAGTLCVLGGHDHLCAVLAAGGTRPGVALDSMGTAEALVMLLPRFLSSPQMAAQAFSCYAYLLPELFALKAGLKAAGGGVEWLARLLDGPQPDYAALQAEAQQGVGRRAGPLWLPHLLGPGSPYGDWRGRAGLVGARLEHTRGDLLRGLLEALALWLRHNLETMHAFSGQEVGEIVLLGGAHRLELLAQLKAHVLQRPVTLPEVPQAAALGAAFLAGWGSREAASVEAAVATLRAPKRVLQPDPRLAGWYEELYQGVYLPLYASLLDLDRTLSAMDARAG